MAKSGDQQPKRFPKSLAELAGIEDQGPKEEPGRGGEGLRPDEHDLVSRRKLQGKLLLGGAVLSAVLALFGLFKWKIEPAVQGIFKGPAEKIQKAIDEEQSPAAIPPPASKTQEQVKPDREKLKKKEVRPRFEIKMKSDTVPQR